MRWKRTDNPDVVDRRGQGGQGRITGFPFPIPAGRGGGGGLALIVIVVLLLVFGRGLVSGDGSTGLSPFDPFPPAQAPSTSDSVPQGDTSFELVKAVSKDVQDFWMTQFGGANKEYERATVVIFTSGTQSGCGPASSATGPFYCPLDHRVYLDVGFFDTLSRRLGAPGDFAQAYVVAHEIGHHVQTLLDIEPEVRRLQQENPDTANQLSVRMELQADCFAGLWGHSVWAGESGNLILEEGDIEEGIAAAEAVGDDRLGAGGRENWTHGSSALRVKWFRQGFESGNANDCDTFSGDV